MEEAEVSVIGRSQPKVIKLKKRGCK